MLKNMMIASKYNSLISFYFQKVIDPEFEAILSIVLVHNRPRAVFKTLSDIYDKALCKLL